MTERPILMSEPMVRAILEGRKTQTRRVLRDQNPIDLGASMHGVHLSKRPVHDHGKLVGHRMAYVNCPHGVPGDRLWVRETFSIAGNGYFFRADVEQPETVKYSWQPSIFMPRAACRLVLEVTAVRVERLQEISEADARAEGSEGWDGTISPGTICYADGARGAYRVLWDSLNARRAPWSSNPWVWVIEFRRVHARGV